LIVFCVDHGFFFGEEVTGAHRLRRVLAAGTGVDKITAVIVVGATWVRFRGIGCGIARGVARVAASSGISRGVARTVAHAVARRVAVARVLGRAAVVDAAVIGAADVLGHIVLGVRRR
jgi:hypothetical protein